MQGKSIRPKITASNLAVYASNLSNKLSGSIEDNRSNVLDFSINEDNIFLQKQADAIDDLITKYKVCNEFYAELIKILDGDF